MESMKKLVASLVFVLLAFFVVESVAAEASPEFKGKKFTEISKIISNLEKKYSNHSFSARFNQKSVLAALETVETARGNVQFSYPKKMRWSYSLPEQNEIITDGKKVWIWRPSQNQVMQGDAASFFTSGVGADFLSNMGRIRDFYNINLLSENELLVEIELIPKNPVPEMKKILVRVSVPEYEIIKVTTYNTHDDSTSFDFDEIRFEHIPDSVFLFIPPTGTEIIPLT